MKRILLATTRIVSNQPEGYRVAWTRLQDHARRCGVRAWLFQAPADSNRYLEFLEWMEPQNGTIEMPSDVQDQHQRLDFFGRGTSESWLET